MVTGPGSALYSQVSSGIFLNLLVLKGLVCKRVSTSNAVTKMMSKNHCEETQSGVLRPAGQHGQ